MDYNKVQRNLHIFTARPSICVVHKDLRLGDNSSSVYSDVHPKGPEQWILTLRHELDLEVPGGDLSDNSIHSYAAAASCSLLVRVE